MLNIKHYSCKYIDPRSRAYPVLAKPIGTDVILRRNRTMIAYIRNKEKKLEEPAVLAYLTPEHAWTQVRQTIHMEDGYDVYTQGFSIQELHGFASLMKLPLVVVVDGFCDLAERKEEYEILYKPWLLQNNNKHDSLKHKELGWHL